MLFQQKTLIWHFFLFLPSKLQMQSFQGRGFFSSLNSATSDLRFSSMCLHFCSRPVSNLRNELAHALLKCPSTIQKLLIALLTNSGLRITFSFQPKFSFSIDPVAVQCSAIVSTFSIRWTQPLRNAPQKFSYLVTSGPSLCGMLRKTSIFSNKWTQPLRYAAQRLGPFDGVQNRLQCI